MKTRLAYVEWEGTLMKGGSYGDFFSYLRLKIQEQQGWFFRSRLEKEFDKTYLWYTQGSQNETDEICTKLKKDSISKDIEAAFERYNLTYVNGLPVWFLEEVTKDYAEQEQGKVDDQLLGALVDFREDNKPPARFIVGPSEMYEGCIKAVLDKKVYRGGLLTNPDDILANGIDKLDGRQKVRKFRLDIFGGPGKAGQLKTHAKDRNMLKPGEIAYIGQEETCLDIMIEIGGKAIIPPLASPSFRQNMASKHGGKIRVVGSPKDVGKALE